MADNIITRAWRDYRSSWRQSLGFHFIMQALGVAIFGPLVTVIARRLVSSAGEPVISNYELVGFVASPVGVLFVLFAVSVSIGLLLAEFAGQSWISAHAIAGSPTTLRATVAVVLRRLPLLLRLGARIFLRLLLIALPFLAVAALLWVTSLREQDINYYLTERPPEWRRTVALIAVLGVIYVLLAARQLARWIFAVPVLVFEPQWPHRAIAASVQLSQGSAWQLFLRLVWWWAPLVLLGLAVTWLGREASDAALGWAGIDFKRVLPLVMLFVCVAAAYSVVFGAVLLGGHQFIVMRTFAELAGEAGWREAIAQETHTDRSRRVAVPVIAGTVALLVLAILGGAFIASRLVEDTPVAITAHRGASIDTPENSMAAFQAAVDGGADYIELDVQRSSDGTVMVVHDGDLMRMAHDPRKVGRTAAADLAAIDIGRNYHARFTGQTVPSLQQVIDLARGRLKINVELKYNVPDEQLAPAVVELLHHNDFVDQVAGRAGTPADQGDRATPEGRPDRDRRCGRRGENRSRLREPQCRARHCAADPRCPPQRQGSARLDRQYTRGDAADDRARCGQHHHGRSGTALAGDPPARRALSWRTAGPATANPVRPASAGGRGPRSGENPLKGFPTRVTDRAAALREACGPCGATSSR